MGARAMSDLPAPPPGFVMDAPQASAPPPPPDGFVLDSQPAAQDKSWHGSILPISADANGTPSFDPHTGILGSLIDAFTLPHDVMAGQVNPTSDQGIARAANMAGVVSPASIESKLPFNTVVPSKGNAVAQAAQNIGVELPRAAISDNPVVQAIGKRMSDIPYVGEPLRTGAEKAINQIGKAADTVQAQYGSGSIPGAGEAARADIFGHIKNTIPGQIGDAYSAVDALVNPDVRVPLSETAKKAAAIVADRNNAKMTGSNAVSQVSKAIAKPPEPQNPIGFVPFSTPETPEAPGMNYAGIKKLRSSIGEMLDGTTPMPADMSKAEAKQIYGALTQDLKTVVQKAGGDDALSAFNTANARAARLSQQRENLNRLLGAKNDEGVFSRIMQAAGSTSTADTKLLLQARHAVDPQTWNEISSAAISRMGRAPDGSFSPDRFTTAWGKLSGNGKRVMFGNSGELSKALDDIATVSQRFKDLNKFANPSGTGGHAALLGIGAALAHNPYTAIPSLIGANMMARLMARPRSATALARLGKASLAYTTNPTNATKVIMNNARHSLARVVTEEGLPVVAQKLRALGENNVPEADQGQQAGANSVAQDQFPYQQPEQQPRQLLPGEM